MVFGLEDGRLFHAKTSEMYNTSYCKTQWDRGHSVGGIARVTHISHIDMQEWGGTDRALFSLSIFF